MTPDPYSTGGELTDVALQQEIELVGDLVVAASHSPGPMSQEEIDRILGLPSGRPGGCGAHHPGVERRGMAIA